MSSFPPSGATILSSALECRAESLPESERHRCLKPLLDVVPVDQIRTDYIALDTIGLYGLLSVLHMVSARTCEAFGKRCNGH
jgi:hypothetical protein